MTKISILIMAVFWGSVAVGQEAEPWADPEVRQGSAAGGESSPELESWQLVDRLVAVVDDDPIFLSDLRRSRVLSGMGDRAVQVGEAGSGRPGQELEGDRELLDRLIDRRLRLHEVERYGDSAISSAQIEESLQAVEAGLGGAEQLDLRLAESELDRDSLRELLRRQLRVLVHIEERIGARIFVDQDEVQAYYDTTLKAEMERQNQPLPPFEQVEQGIRDLLREQALNREIQVWTDELRNAAKVVDLLDRTPRLESMPQVQLEIPLAEDPETRIPG